MFNWRGQTAGVPQGQLITVPVYMTMQRGDIILETARKKKYISSTLNRNSLVVDRCRFC